MFVKNIDYVIDPNPITVQDSTLSFCCKTTIPPLRMLSANFDSITLVYSIETMVEWQDLATSTFIVSDENIWNPQSDSVDVFTKINPDDVPNSIYKSIIIHKKGKEKSTGYFPFAEVEMR